MQTDSHKLSKDVNQWKVHTEKNRFEVLQINILYAFCYKIWTLLE